MEPLPETKLNVDEFLDWSERQSEGRYELVDGTVVMMAPERVLNAETKFQTTLALRLAIEKAGVDCRALIDGAGVQVASNRVRIPDASVQCGSIDDAAQLLTNPVVVVEVISPSSARNDAIAKLSDYFSVPSILHYLIVDPVDRMIIRHSRVDASSDIHTQIHRTGAIELSPPGIVVSAEDVLGPERTETATEEGA